MEIPLRAALVDWLAQAPALAGQINSVTEEAPARAAIPWLAIAASASADWGVKERAGREVRVALELHCRGDRPDTAAALTSQIEQRIEAFPASHAGFDIASVRFLRARSEQRAGNIRSILLEYRFRVLAA